MICPRSGCLCMWGTWQGLYSNKDGQSIGSEKRTEIMPNGDLDRLLHTYVKRGWWMISFIPTLKNHSAERLQYERCWSDVRKIFLLGEVIKHSNWLLMVMESPFLNDTHSSMCLKRVFSAMAPRHVILSLFLKVPSISVNPECMKHPGKFT